MSNVYIEISGRKVQVTLRDSDETHLLARLTTLLQQYPIAEPPAAAATPGSGLQGVAQPTPEGWCLRHGTQMKLQTNERGSWWSHQNGVKADGKPAWCRGK